MQKRLEIVLSAMEEKRASDLHISAGAPMHYRIDGRLYPVDETVLTDEEARKVIYSLLREEETLEFEKRKELDLSFEIEGVARFRANVFFQRGRPGCAIRRIPYSIMSIEECGLPVDIVKDFCRADKGLVLITGATGSGKSTTLAAMVDEINSSRDCHIVTVEDPIEFVHENRKSLIDQRQIRRDTDSFSNALKYVLRQDPDVIFIGELRDLDSVMQAMIIADTGHLVLATLHTSDCIQSINRIIDVFPSHQQRQVRTQLSFVLLGIISQQLLPRQDAKGMALASEVLISTPAVRSMIRDGKEHQLYSVLQTSQKIGMRSMNQALYELHGKGMVSYDEAVAKSTDVEELIQLIEGGK